MHKNLSVEEEKSHKLNPSQQPAPHQPPKALKNQDSFFLDKEKFGGFEAIKQMLKKKLEDVTTTTDEKQDIKKRLERIKRAEKKKKKKRRLKEMQNDSESVSTKPEANFDSYETL